jgi:hypothetical protein
LFTPRFHFVLKPQQLQHGVGEKEAAASGPLSRMTVGCSFCQARLAEEFRGWPARSGADKDVIDKISWGGHGIHIATGLRAKAGSDYPLNVERPSPMPFNPFLGLWFQSRSCKIFVIEKMERSDRSNSQKTLPRRGTNIDTWLVPESSSVRKVHLLQ